MSYADDATEKSLISLEKKIVKEYKQAYAGMKAKADKYFEDYKVRWEKEYKAYLKGEYTDAEFKAWEQTQLARGKRWNALKDDLAKRMTEANKVASSYINDKTPSIYSLNQNYQAYEIGKGLNNVSFTMYDEQAVKGLIQGNNATEFRTVKINPKRDYEWNKEQIQSALVSGILQGKKINEISDSFLAVMQRNQNSAVRNARTAYTSAQNGGRIESMKQAEKQGIDIKKKWLSAHDGRVRDSHAFLDGQIRPVSKAFDNGCMYPSDPAGAPQEVYNCRCTLTYVYPKFQNQESREAFTDQKLKNETFRQFVKRMQTQDNVERTKEGVTISNKRDNVTLKIIPNKNFKKITEEEFTKLSHSVSQEERNILYGKGHFSGYVNSALAKDINRAIRENQPLSDKFNQIKNTLSEVISKNSMPMDVEVVRYVGIDAFKNLTGVEPQQPSMRFTKEQYIEKVNETLKSVKKGYIDVEHNFLSASLIEDKNVMTDKAIEMHIKVEKGKNCYITTNKKESEVIFGIDEQLELESIVYDTNRIPYKYVINYRML